MAYYQSLDVISRLEDQPVNIGEGPLVASDLVNDKGSHAAETGKIKVLRFFEHEIGDEVGETARNVSPNRMLLFIIAGVDDLLSAGLGEGKKSHDLLGRVL